MTTRATPLRVRFRRGRQPGPGDAGSAVVEFVGATLVLLVPLVYLVVVLAAVQSATFAVDGAAREAARAVVTAVDADDAGPRATAAVALALGDQGLDPALADDALAVRCEPDCATPGTTVTVEVALQVPLPGVPGFVRDAVPLTIPVSAVVTAPVDDYRSRGTG